MERITTDDSNALPTGESGQMTSEAPTGTPNHPIAARVDVDMTGTVPPASNVNVLKSATSGALSPPATYPADSQLHAALSAMILVLFTIILGWMWYSALESLEGLALQESSQKWSMPNSVTLQAGPAGFRYDLGSQLLSNVGAIDDRRKAELVGLLMSKSTEPVERDVQLTYATSIDKLAVATRKIASLSAMGLLLLGGISGMLGVQLRSMTNFVGIACFKNELDMARWWPYYVIRPFSGFLLGVIVVIIVKAGYLQATGGFPAESAGWIAISLLAGFGADEFTQRLRRLSQTMFGEAKS
jgi:hypothetical protein